MFLRRLVDFCIEYSCVADEKGFGWLKQKCPLRQVKLRKLKKVG